MAPSSAFQSRTVPSPRAGDEAPAEAGGSEARRTPRLRRDECRVSVAKTLARGGPDGDGRGGKMLTRYLMVAARSARRRFVCRDTRRRVVVCRNVRQRNDALIAAQGVASFAVGFEPGAGGGKRWRRGRGRRRSELAPRARSSSSRKRKEDASSGGGRGKSIRTADAAGWSRGRARRARELVVARGEHESTGGVETDGAARLFATRGGPRWGPRRREGPEASAPAGVVRGGATAASASRSDASRDEAVEREVVHADGRAETRRARAGDDAPRSAGDAAWSASFRQLSPGPPLPGRAPPPSPPLPLFASLASHRDDRASPRESNETCRGARVECAGRGGSRARRCDRWPSNGARAGRSARAAARGNRGGRSGVARVSWYRRISHFPRRTFPRGS